VTRPTLALIGEGGEDEYVVPASKMGRMGGGVTVNVGGVNVQASDLGAAADLAAAKVRDAVLNSGDYSRSLRHGLSRRL